MKNSGEQNDKVSQESSKMSGLVKSKHDKNAQNKKQGV
jgi:hypothetical protein